MAEITYEDGRTAKIRAFIKIRDVDVFAEEGMGRG
jgi:hypothetical protein